MKTCIELLKDWRLALNEKVSMKVSDENLACAEGNILKFPMRVNLEEEPLVYVVLGANDGRI